ncbi:conserved Plasmodium membrane protein, unknown function [Plasmodium sp. DRC-Itaito]|nr:conserved Plasmodium membrane protein, unknown function [Plasmodium sp. DRC-Itaito]
MKKHHKKFPNEMNLFLINSIYTLTLLMFLEIFFFLLDGINTFEVITLKERLSQIIWCFFFCFHLALLKIAEVFWENTSGKPIISIHYLFILYIIILPLSSSLLFTSSLSWTKLIYFTYILSLVTSIHIRKLLLICNITLITGVLSFYHNLPNYNIIICFTLLLLVHIIICITIHVALYILAKHIFYIKRKPLRALDNIEPYFHELEKKAILIRNNLIYYQQNKISVDILGNYLFENEVKDGIKKIKTINKSEINLEDYYDDTTNANYDTPMDISDINYYSNDEFKVNVENDSEDIEMSSLKKMNIEKNKINDYYSKNVIKCNNEENIHVESNIEIDNINLCNENYTYNKNKKKKENVKKEETNILLKDNSSIYIDNNNNNDDDEINKHVTSYEKYFSAQNNDYISQNNSCSSQKYNNTLYSHSNFKRFNNKIVNKKLDALNNEDYGETYKKKIVQKHFSLLRSGPGKCNRKRNILLTEELKNKINYIYFDKNGKIKQSKIIPLYVLERHNLNDLSIYLKNDTCIKINSYYNFFAIFNNNSNLTTDGAIYNKGVINLSSIKSTLKTNNTSIYDIKSRSKNEDTKLDCFHLKRSVLRNCLIFKKKYFYKYNYNNSSSGSSIKYFMNNEKKISQNKTFDVRNSKFITATEKRRICTSKLYSMNENSPYDALILKCGNDKRVFYSIYSDHMENNESQSSSESVSDIKNKNEHFDMNINRRTSYIQHFHSNRQEHDDMIHRKISKFQINKSIKTQNTLFSEESNENMLFSNNAFYVDDGLDKSINTDNIQDSEIESNKYNTSSCSSFPTSDMKNERMNNKNMIGMYDNIDLPKKESFIKLNNNSCKKNKHSLDSISSMNDFLNGSYEGSLKNEKEKKEKPENYGIKLGTNDMSNEILCNREISSIQGGILPTFDHNKREQKRIKKENIQNKTFDSRDTYKRKKPERTEESIGNDHFSLCKKCRSKKQFDGIISKKKSTCKYISNLSLNKKKSKESHLSIYKKYFFEFYDCIPINYKKKPHNIEKQKFSYNIKKVFLCIKLFNIIWIKIKTWYKKIDKKEKYWKRYNDILYTSQWKNNIQDNELEYILKYKNFMKWYNYWVKTVLFNYYKSTWALNLLLYILNVLLIYLQMHMFYFLFEINKDQVKYSNILKIEENSKTKFPLNHFMDKNKYIPFTYIRISLQLIINIIFCLPSMVIKNIKRIKMLHIFSILNCLVNIFFGMIDIVYSLNDKIFNINDLYALLNHYNVFDVFLIGKLITSIFLIPFFTNFNESKTCALIYFSCICYISTFYYSFNPLTFSIKLMYLTIFVILIAVTVSTSYYAKLIMKSRKMLFVKYVLPYFIYLTFLNTDPNIQMEIKEKKRKRSK